MLGKLFKHEWKATCKVGILMLILIAVVTFFGWLAFQTPMWQQLSNETYYGKLSTLDVLSIVTLIMYAMMLVGVTYGTLIYLGVHFYKTMYTDEGYLTHTLPVTKNQLLVSKILVSGIWNLIVSAAVILSVCGLLIFMISAVMPADLTWGDIIETLEENWDAFMSVLKDELGVNLVQWIVLMLVTFLLTPFLSMIVLFGAISIGQLFTKHRVLMAIVCYGGIMILSMVVSSVVQSITSMQSLNSMMQETVALNNYLNASMLSGAIQNIVMAAILYFASYFVISQKLNME